MRGILLGLVVGLTLATPVFAQETGLPEAVLYARMSAWQKVTDCDRRTEEIRNGQPVDKRACDELAALVEQAIVNDPYWPVSVMSE
jgi:hypothetical protein